MRCCIGEARNSCFGFPERFPLSPQEFLHAAFGEAERTPAEDADGAQEDVAAGIELVTEAVNGDGPALADAGSHDADNVVIGSGVLLVDAVVAKDDVVTVRQNPDDAMQNVLVAAVVENNVVFAAALRGHLPAHRKEVAPLHQKRAHADTLEGVGHLAKLI